MSNLTISNELLPHTPQSSDLKVSDAVWVATALLHEQHPEKSKFPTEDIVGMVTSLHLTSAAYKSIWQHVNQHCVANRKPQPNRSRMLTGEGHGDRRLFRQNDKFDPGRDGAPTHPEWSALPSEYRYLEEWFRHWEGSFRGSDDILLELIGTGRGHFGTLGADEYVRSLRENWESR